jgi:hypothetical protein
MPACLVRGRDEHGHFDLQPPPQQDYGREATARHDATFHAYLESFYEQLHLVEKDVKIDADAAAAMMN